MAQSMPIKRILIGLHQLCVDIHFMPILTQNDVPFTDAAACLKKCRPAHLPQP